MILGWIDYAGRVIDEIHTEDTASADRVRYPGPELLEHQVDHWSLLHCAAIVVVEQPNRFYQPVHVGENGIAR